MHFLLFLASTLYLITSDNLAIINVLFTFSSKHPLPDHIWLSGHQKCFSYFFLKAHFNWSFLIIWTSEMNLLLSLLSGRVDDLISFAFVDFDKIMFSTDLLEKRWLDLYYQYEYWSPLESYCQNLNLFSLLWKKLCR